MNSKHITVKKALIKMTAMVVAILFLLTTLWVGSFSAYSANTSKATTCAVTPPLWYEDSLVNGDASNPIKGDIVLSDTNITLNYNQTYTISAISTTAQNISNLVIWESNNTSVATVSSGGIVHALSEGYAIISAKVIGTNKSVACTVKVNPVPTQAVVLSKSDLTLEKNSSAAISAVTNPTGKAVVWTSSNTSVATVTSGGTVKAVAVGKTTIKATAVDSGVSASCLVTVTEISTKSVSISKTALSLDKGNSHTLTATTSPVGKSVNWSSSNASVATVSSAGVVKAIGAGTATITVKAADTGVSATCKVTVTATAVQTIKLTSTSSSIYVGNHAYITATTAPTSFAVNWSSSNTAVATVTNGIVKGVKAGSATITAKDSTGMVSASYTISVTSAPSTNIVLSNVAGTVAADKTFLIKSYTSGVTWSSSNTSVATVSDGYIYAKAKGVAIISAKYGSQIKTCALTVTDSAPIRFSYSSPNCATLNDTVTFVAITDKTRTAVQFKTTIGGKQYTLDATSKATDSQNKCYIWKATLKVTTAGTFDVTAYSQKNGVWSTCSDGNSQLYVCAVSSPATVSFAVRRASDELLKLNATYEGFLSSVTEDPLVSNAPTLGHGKVVTAGEMFYNNISREEAYAYLVKTMNSGAFTNSVNEYMDTYNIKFNQQQFDALVMLSYNLGASVLYDSDVKSILLDCVESGSSQNSSIMYVNSSDGLNLRSGPGTSYGVVKTLANNTKVTILEKTSSSWYYVKLTDGTVGYCAADYLVAGSGNTVRNLNLVNNNALINELTLWHHAGGHCVWGLLYRRIDELEIFIYSDYTLDGSKNKYAMPYVWHE